MVRVFGICCLTTIVGCTRGTKATQDTSTAPADTAAALGFDPTRGIAENCWSDINAREAGFPDYDAMGVQAKSCSGSAHQVIENIERVVFLGDSITAGTPPTASEDFYRNQLAAAMRERFGEDLVVDDCSRFGARTDDYLPEQIPACFPDIETRRTLVFATNGGNDLFAAADVVLNGGSEEDGLAVLQRAIDYQREALSYFRDNTDRFPNGVNVVVANVYEFTDTTGNLSACELADTLGFGGQVDAVVEATQFLNAAWAEVAIDTETDFLFLNETFCGHGYDRENPAGPCYRGPDTPLYFDPSCIHPSTEGHTAIAGMFAEVVDASALP